MDTNQSLPGTLAENMQLTVFKEYNIAQISFLIACGSALQLAEYFIPIPVPGLRMGLANISTLIGLVLFGPPAAMEIALFQPIVASMTNGTFLSPGFFLTLSGSLGCFLFMSAVYYLFRKRNPLPVIGIAIIGMLGYSVTQILVTYFWFIRHKGVFVLSPLVIVASIAMGYVVGRAGKYAMRRLILEKDLKDENAILFQLGKEEFGAPALKDKIKLVAALAMVASTIFWGNTRIYLGLILLVLVLIYVYGHSLHLTRLFRLSGAILFSFVLPVLFTVQGDIYWHWGWITVSSVGVHQGILFSLRLIFLIMISIWIGLTDPRTLSQELAWVLSPLKIFHFSVERIPRLLSLSLSFIPVVWEKLTHVKPKTMRNVLNALAAFFVTLEAESEDVSIDNEQ